MIPTCAARSSVVSCAKAARSPLPSTARRPKRRSIARRPELVLTDLRDAARRRPRGGGARGAAARAGRGPHRARHGAGRRRADARGCGKLSHEAFYARHPTQPLVRHIRARRAGRGRRRRGFVPRRARRRRRRRRDRRDRPHHRRERHRQGAASRAPSTRVAARAGGPFVAVNCARHPRDAPRERALRPRARRLHRRRRTTAPAASSSPTAARSSSTRSATCRCRIQAKLLRVLQEREFERARRHRRAQGRRAHHRRHQPRSRRAMVQGGTLPRGSLLPPQRRRRSQLPPLRERARATSRSLAEHFLAVRQARHGTHVAGPRPSVLEALHATTRGRATCASSATSSSAW